MPLDFQTISAETPTRESLTERYRALNALLDDGEIAECLAAFDRLRRAIDTWSALVGLRFEQDTSDEAAKAARDYRDALFPVATEHETAFKQRLLALPDRHRLETIAGAHGVSLWEADITTFRPEIGPDLERESVLAARYTELLAGAHLSVRGTGTNLSGLAPFAQSLDPAVRKEAAEERWGFFAANAAALDDIYDEQVRLRHGMALKLGYETFTPLAYKRLRRTDYGMADVARYREQVLAHVVPLAARLNEKRRADFGLACVHAWDEALIDPAGNTVPQGDHDALLDAAQAMYDAMHPELGAFFRHMRGGNFLDLRNRPSKAGGGFCTSFPTLGQPFVFANFNGTHHDVDVLTHEMGHAFQCFASRDLPGIDYLWPTYEACEIHSMSLEFLCHKHIGLLVGEAAAERYRRMHLQQALEFLPYGVLVDHFQHEVYASPEASAAERHALWLKLERLYMPWRNWGDLAYPAKGASWQAKQHIYASPFYYIDYTLAQCCALQFWAKSRENHALALETYVGLCRRGGSAPFQALVASAGLISPFAEGALEAVVREAEDALGS